MIDRDTLDQKRAEYVRKIEEYQISIYALQGAVQAVDELIGMLAAPEDHADAITMDQLKEMTGAAEVGEPERR